MPKEITNLENETDSKKLITTACEFAASDQPADQSTIARFLDSRGFLLRVNTEDEYFHLRPKSLRVAKVVKVLMDSPHPAAKRTLVGLTRAKEFQSFELLQDLLVRALAAVRPSPPDAISYWDTHSQPDACNLHLVIEAIFANGSDPALGLFERIIANPQQEIECKTIWFRDPMLRHRNDTPVLNSCERMVVKGLAPEEVRPLIVEALCGYDRDWYLGCKKPRPPLRALAPQESKQILMRICEFADQKMTLEPHVEAYLRTTMIELGMRRAGQESEAGA